MQLLSTSHVAFLHSFYKHLVGACCGPGIANAVANKINKIKSSPLGSCVLLGTGKKKRYMDKRRWFWREGVIGGAVVWGGDAISDSK